MNEPLVVIKDVVKKFPLQVSPALDGINIQIPKGQIVGMAGPDGAGKTTLLRLIAGLLKPNSGTISVAGYDTIKDADQICTLIGYMPQKFGLYEDLSVLQNLNLYADLRGVVPSERKATFDKLLSFTGLAPFTKRLAGNLSGGMKQKLGLACALVKKPTLLLLDEPSVGVDPISRRELWKMVQELLKDDITVIWSTAYLDEAERADTVLLINEGRVLYNGSPKALLKDKDKFEDAFINILGGISVTTSVLAEKTPSVAEASHAVIQAEGLTKKFGDFTAAADITFSVNSGEIFGLLGPNGAGKSTTFKMLCGLLKPTSGKAFVNGLDLEKAPSEARSHIGYMAQKFSLYGNLSVGQNLDFFSGIYNLRGKHQKEMIEEMIDIFGLKHYLNENADTLPLGFKQRLALSCALMHRPRVLFLDEPTSGVDPITRREFWTHITGLAKKGITIMVTTHFMEEAEYCDRIALVYRGGIIKMGTPADLKKAAITKEILLPTLDDAFIQLIKRYDEDNLHVT
ncbi:MAG: ATP-binding cassette domain-containing protein [Parachlamydiaceae bacterium]